MENVLELPYKTTEIKVYQATMKFNGGDATRVRDTLEELQDSVNYALKEGGYKLIKIEEITRTQIVMEATNETV